MAGLVTTPHVGSRLGDRYELVRHIARGGMGDVYAARDEMLQRDVAVKVYRAASPSDRARFDSEVRVLAGLNHPGLARVYDAGPHGDDAYVVLELIDGPTLAEAIAGRGALPPEEVAALGADVAASLAYIHAQGVVHRDVTPSNVICDPSGRPRLVDFGIVRLLDTPRVTASLTTLGTAAYMAPEQVQGLEVTTAVDVYALGLVLLELLTGDRPFTGTAHEVAAARLVRDPDVTRVPAAWRPLLLEMTARSPQERPTAEEVETRLGRLAAGADVMTAPFVLSGEHTAPMATTTAVLDAAPLPIELEEPPVVHEGRRRSHRAALLAAGVGVALALALALVAWADQPTQPLDPADTTSPSLAQTGTEDSDDGAPVTTAPTTTLATTTTAPTSEPLLEFPEGFPFEDGGPGQGKDKKDDDD